MTHDSGKGMISLGGGKEKRVSDGRKGKNRRGKAPREPSIADGLFVVLVIVGSACDRLIWK